MNLDIESGYDHTRVLRDDTLHFIVWKMYCHNLLLISCGNFGNQIHKGICFDHSITNYNSYVYCHYFE